MKNTRVLKIGMCVGCVWDEMVYMKAILMSYVYTEFDNTIYFWGIMLEKRFFEYKVIGGNRSERYVLQEIHCNSNSAYTIL